MVFCKYFLFHRTVAKMFCLQNLVLSLSLNVLQKIENRLTIKKVMPKNNFPVQNIMEGR